MDNISEIPYKERGLCNCGEEPREASVLVENGYVQKKKGLSGPHESYDIVGYLMGGFKGKLKGSKSLRKFANIRCIEAKEVKRTKQKGLDF